MPPEGYGARRPVRLALAADAAVVTAGVQSIVAAAGADLEMTALADGEPLPDVDIVLYDPQRGAPPVRTATLGRPAPTLIAFSWSVTPDIEGKARAQGAVGLLSKDLPAHRLLAAVRALHAGDRMDSYTVAPDPSATAARRERRPDGLTAREIEMLQLITEGLSNEEIARQLYLSINSVKTYIRTAYRKIGVTRRPQAVLWGVHHGFGDLPVRGAPR